MLGQLSWNGGQHEIDLESSYYGEMYHLIPENVRPESEYKEHNWGRWKIQFDLLHIFNKEPLKLLHYKFIGAEHVADRHSQYVERNSKYNIENDKGRHYIKTNTLESTQQEIDALLNKAEELDI